MTRVWTIYFVRQTCDRVLLSRMMFVYQNVCGMVYKWADAEGRCVCKSYYSEIDDVEIHWIDCSS